MLCWRYASSGNERKVPLTVVAAGLPRTRGVLAEAATYSERMFDTRTVDALDPLAAREALARPAADEGVSIEEAALDDDEHQRR